MVKLSLTIFTCIIIISCFSSSSDTFNSDELMSSRGEKIYINTLNWGITGDYQRSAISDNKDKIRERSDTSETIKGSYPFFYSFKDDTLSLYFVDTISYRLQDNFKTIYLKYILLNNKHYQKIRTKAYNNQENYHSVPTRKIIDYPSDMPVPPRGAK